MINGLYFDYLPRRPPPDFRFGAEFPDFGLLLLEGGPGFEYFEENEPSGFGFLLAGFLL